VAELARARGGPRGGGLTAVSADAVETLLERRLDANGRFFATEAPRIAELCRELAGRFDRGGRLVAVGGSSQAWSDAHHIAVEFVHPVIVGKRALPALAAAPGDAGLLAGPEDAVVSFEPLTFATADGEWRFDPPTDDPFVCQELCETLYHVVWELVHVFFEHLGSSTAGGGAAGFLYPFLESDGETDLAAVVDDVRRSVLMKAQEVSELRTQTLRENGDALAAAAATLRRAFAAGGTLLAFGNGGSATDAADLVADCVHPPRPWPQRRALDLTGDSAILTALANDIGPEVLFARQLIAYGRPGDVALALSTSGGSGNVLEALAEARRRGLATIALVGYDGGRIAAERLADHVVVTRSDHIPRIQEAQASAYHALRELVELCEP
jgi:D-sedoheptulose 7-phosphate isomerase